MNTLALAIMIASFVCGAVCASFAAIGVYRFGVAWMRSEDTFF